MINKFQNIKVIIDEIVQNHSFENFNLTNKSLFFNLKFCSLLYYFFGI